MKILIAEDDNTTRLLLENLLSVHNYDVVSTSDGLEAWEIIQSDTKIGMVVLDWMMPSLNGLEICSKIRDFIDEFRYTYTILLSANTSELHAVEGLNSGADDYIRKPFHNEELLARINIGKRIVDLEREQRKLIRQFKALSMSDSLTGLLNHNAIKTRIVQDIAREYRNNNPVTVLILDIDFFKDINDTYGHPVGDEVIKFFSKLLKDSCRAYDSIGRYGGDEFIVELPGINKRQAKTIVLRMHKSIGKASFNIDDKSLKIHVSIGVKTCMPEKDIDMDLIIKEADNALYMAKRSGRNKVIFV